GQLSPQGISNVFGQRRSREAFHVEIFDCDPTKAVDAIAGNFMNMVPGPIADAGMKFGERSFSLRPGLGTTLAAGNSAVPTPQFACRALRPAGTLGRLPVAESHKARQAEVNADAIVPSSLDWRHFDVETTRHLPTCRVRTAEVGLLGSSRCHRTLTTRHAYEA